MQTRIDDEDAIIGAAEPASKFKADLVKLNESFMKASQTYTRTKYDEFVSEWLKQDAAIAELIRKLECAVVLALHTRLLRLPPA